MKKLTALAAMATACFSACIMADTTTTTEPALTPTTSAAPTATTATTPATTPATTTTTATSKTSVATPNPTVLCPHINEMKKDASKDSWTAQTKAGFWKSYGVSFATTLTKFTGAQWAGEKVGQMTCVYNSEQVFTIQKQQVIQPTLPVLMVFHTLTFQPTAANWKHVKKGVYNCASENRADCPFVVNEPKPVGNIFEQAESFKTNPKPALQPTNH